MCQNVLVQDCVAVKNRYGVEIEHKYTCVRYIGVFTFYYYYYYSSNIHDTTAHKGGYKYLYKNRNNQSIF